MLAAMIFVILAGTFAGGDLVTVDKQLTAMEVHDRAHGRMEAIVNIQGVLATRITTLDNKVARLEHHFVTLDKQLGKQARRIEELETDRRLLDSTQRMADIVQGCLRVSRNWKRRKRARGIANDDAI